MLKATTFSLFTADAFEYVMGIKGVNWNTGKVFDEVPAGIRTLFDDRFGDAVICYLIRHEEQITELTKVASFSTSDEIAKFGKYALSKICKDDCFLLDIIRVFALFSDVAMSYHEQGKSQLISVIVEYLRDYYLYYLVQPLTIIGGYCALFRFSQQYSEFYNNDLDEKIESARIKGEHTFVTAPENEIPSSDISENNLPTKNENIKTSTESSPEFYDKNDIASILKHALEQECLATKIAFYKNLCIQTEK